MIRSKPGAGSWQSGLRKLGSRAIVLALVLGVAMVAAAARPYSIRLVVTVTDCSTTQPIQGATVKVLSAATVLGSQHQAITDATGSAVIDPLLVGGVDHTVEASAAGYIRKTQKQLMQDGSTVAMSICLDRDGLLQTETPTPTYTPTITATPTVTGTPPPLHTPTTDAPTPDVTATPVGWLSNPWLKNAGIATAACCAGVLLVGALLGIVIGIRRSRRGKAQPAASAGRECPRCGANCQVDARFCYKCGLSFVQPAAAQDMGMQQPAIAQPYMPPTPAVPPPPAAQSYAPPAPAAQPPAMPPPAPPIACTKCGQALRPESKFCLKCGQPTGR